jgi:hypothetical protein
MHTGGTAAKQAAGQRQTGGAPPTPVDKLRTAREPLTGTSQGRERCMRPPVRAREHEEQRVRSEVLLRVCGLREGVRDQTRWFMRRPLQSVRFWLCFFPLRLCAHMCRGVCFWG